MPWVNPATRPTPPAQSHVEFSPPVSTVPFLTGEKFIEFIVGPLGSAKTSAAIMKIAYHAAKMAQCTDGIRRSRCVWVRNSREQLRDTSIPDFLKWFPDGLAGTFHKTDYRFVLRFDDVECEVMWRGLDDQNDVRRLLSLQASFAVFDEFREIHPQIFEAMQGRLGRYPDKMLVPPRPEWGVDAKGHPIGGCVYEDGTMAKRLWGATNPPDAETYWERFLRDPPKNAHVTFQPSGLSPDADWLQFLDPGYYENLAEGKTDEWIDVYIHAKFGRSLSGKPVYTGFNRDFHVSKTPLQPIVSAERPLLIGVDLGLTPACTISQQDYYGRVLTFAEITSTNMGATRFIRDKLRPLLAERFPGHPVAVICDPAGTQRAQTDERMVTEVFQAHGFNIIPARTNVLAARIAAVEGLLAGQTDGGARHLIDSRCKMLIEGMTGRYRYKVAKDESLAPKPDKNPWSHVCEAHQYMSLHVDGLFGAVRRTGARPVVKRRSGGWT